MLSFLRLTKDSLIQVSVETNTSEADAGYLQSTNAIQLSDLVECLWSDVLSIRQGVFEQSSPSILVKCIPFLRGEMGHWYTDVSTSIIPLVALTVKTWHGRHEIPNRVELVPSVDDLHLVIGNALEGRC